MAELNKRNLFEESKKMSSWEKIESGIHDFEVVKVEVCETQVSKKLAIHYYGMIKNSKGIKQQTKIVDNIDTEDNYKFAFARLIKFLKKFNIDESNINSETEALQLANSDLVVGKCLKIQWTSRMINGRAIKEKSFILD